MNNRRPDYPREVIAYAVVHRDDWGAAEYFRKLHTAQAYANALNSRPHYHPRDYRRIVAIFEAEGHETGR